MTGPCKSRTIIIVLDDARLRQQNNCIFKRENLVGRVSGLVGEMWGRAGCEEKLKRCLGMKFSGRISFLARCLLHVEGPLCEVSEGLAGRVHETFCPGSSDRVCVYSIHDGACGFLVGRKWQVPGPQRLALSHVRDLLSEHREMLG